MNREDLKTQALLVNGEEKIPIYAKYATNYSLLIRFPSGHCFPYGARFPKVIIPVNGKKAEVGPCQLVAEPQIDDGYVGRLTFSHDLHALKNLLLNHSATKVQTAFRDLPVLLAHKRLIKQSFKEYTANLRYDLNVYRELFDTMDSEYSVRSTDSKDSYQRAQRDTEGQKFMNFLDEKLDELERTVADFKKEEHQHHGYYFRKQLWDIMLSVPLMKRTNLKPRGYAGDSQIMRMIYSNDYQGKSFFSKLMHKHGVSHTAAQSVRNRIDLVAKMLGKVQSESHLSPGQRLKVLSVGCGPAFEMIELLKSPQDCERYHFTLLDQDPFALYEAADTIGRIEKNLGAKTEVDYCKESVRTLFSTRQFKRRWGEFDFIYSLGLFDYLAPRVGRAVLEKLHQLLKPGGEMVIGNFHVSNSSRYYMEYWYDWVLYHRTEEEFMDLAKDISQAEVSLFFENTESQMFLHIKQAK